MGCERDRGLEKHIQDLGYQVNYSMTLVRLNQNESGKVAGAIFTDAKGAYVKINAENVILATGGYPGNPKMVKALAPIGNECVAANSYYASGYRHGHPRRDLGWREDGHDRCADDL